jgi:hypothetical protein
MDPLRLLLISSTAVLSLMLLIEWNQYSDDYNKNQAERYAAEVLNAPGMSPAYNDQTAGARSDSTLSDIPMVSADTTPLPSDGYTGGLAPLNHRHTQSSRKRRWW